VIAENASTEMTMLIELDSGNRASLRSLFDGYPCLHGVVAAVIEGGMGRIFADAREEPAWPSPYSIFISLRATRSMQMPRWSSNSSSPATRS